MIFKFHVGTDIRRTMDYIQGPGSGNDPNRATTLGGQGFGFEPKTDEDVQLAVGMMVHNADPSMQASSTKKCKLTAGHGILAWAPGQQADPDEMLNAGRHFLRQLGMGGAMAIFTQHKDKPRGPGPNDGLHIHMGVSLIDPSTGLTYDRYQFIHRGQHTAVQWERDNNKIHPSRQRDHDRADAARKLDYARIKRLLEEEGQDATHREIDRTLTLGGHFGPHLGAAREGWRKYLKEPKLEPKQEPKQEPKLEPKQEPKQEPRREPKQEPPGWWQPDRPDGRWWMEPAEPTPKPAKDEPKQEQPEPKQEPVPEPRGRHEPTAEDIIRGLMGGADRPVRQDPKTRHFEGPQGGQAGTGNLEDRTDQTAEGRAYLKRQRDRDKDRGLGR